MNGKKEGKRKEERGERNSARRNQESEGGDGTKEEINGRARWTPRGREFQVEEKATRESKSRGGGRGRRERPPS